MNIALIITIVVCLGAIFLLSLKSKKSRTYRRRAYAICCCILFAAALIIPPDYNLMKKGELPDSDSTSSGQEDSYVKESADEQEDSYVHEPASVHMASDIDFSEFTIVQCVDVEATNFLATSLGEYPCTNAFDGNVVTCWQDGVEGNGEGTELYATLSESSDIQYIVIYNGQGVNDTKYEENGRVAQLEISNGEYTETVDLTDINAPFAIKLNDWNNVSSVTFKINSVYQGTTYMDTCISEIQFYKSAAEKN